MVSDKPRLLPPDSKIGPGANLLWAIPAALVAIAFCSTVGLLFWCGDGSAESCDDPERTRELLTHAIWWIVTGGVVGGAIVAIAPWGRLRVRLIVGSVTAALVIGAGLIYLSL